MAMIKRKTPVPATKSRKWLVSLPQGVSAVVKGLDEADAWANFKALCGIVRSDHQPVIRRLNANETLEVDDNGVVVTPRNTQTKSKTPKYDEDGDEV